MPARTTYVAAFPGPTPQLDTNLPTFPYAHIYSPAHSACAVPTMPPPFPGTRARYIYYPRRPFTDSPFRWTLT